MSIHQPGSRGVRVSFSTQPGSAPAEALIKRVEETSINGTKTAAIQEFARSSVFPAAALPRLLASYSFDDDRKSGLLALKGRLEGPVDEAAVRAVFRFSSTADDALRALNAAPSASRATGARADTYVSVSVSGAGGPLSAEAQKLLKDVETTGHNGSKTDRIRTYAEAHRFPAAALPNLLATYTFDDDRKSGLLALKGKLDGSLDEAAVRAAFRFSSTADEALRALNAPRRDTGVRADGPVSVTVTGTQAPLPAEAQKLLKDVETTGHNGSKTDRIRIYAEAHRFPAAALPNLLASYAFDDDRKSGLLALKGKLDGPLDDAAVRAVFRFSSTADEALKALNAPPRGSAGISVRGGIGARVTLATDDNVAARALLNRVNAESFDSRKQEAVEAFARTNTIPASLLPALLQSFEFDSSRAAAIASLRGKVTGSADVDAIRAAFSFSSTADRALKDAGIA